MQSSRLCAASALLLVALTACDGGAGTGSEGGSTTTVTAKEGDWPTAATPVRQVASSIAEASRDQSCNKLAALIHPYLRPSDPGRQSQQCNGFLALTKAMTVLSARSYGSGAVVDYSWQDGERRPTYTAILALSGREYRLFAVEGEHPTGTVKSVPAQVARFDANAQAAISAIRAGDCETLHQIAHPRLSPGHADKLEFCGQYMGSGFQKALQESPQAQPVRMGGNAIYAFYSLRVAQDRFYTVVTGVFQGTPRFISELRA